MPCVRARALLLALPLLAVAACSNDPERSEAAYCTAVSANLAQLNAPAIATASDVESTLSMYRNITRSAPLAIESEWKRLVTNLETAASVVPTDADSMQRAADMARETEPAAVRVSSYTMQLCQLQIGAAVPVTTPAASTTAPATTEG
jgi:hypothetical protein